METTEMAVIVGMQEDVSTKMPKVTSELQKTKEATRELASGVMYMGSMFMSASIAMSKSNNESIKSASSMLMMVGSIMTAVGSAAQFVSAAARIANALKAVNIQLIVQKALSGPAGWALLAGAVAAGGIAAYKLSGSSNKQQQTINLNTTVKLDGKKVGESSRQQIIKTQGRNGTSGIQ